MVLRFSIFHHLKKYKDAILFWAKMEKVKLLGSFMAQIGAFMDLLKKENQKGKMTNA